MDAARLFLMANFERARDGATYDDAYIERWADVYLANPGLRLQGVPFCRFLAAPSAWLMWLGRQRQPRPQEALSAAEMVQVRRAMERTSAMGNGLRIEKLRHHAHPRSAGRDFKRERQA